jgi:uncharacterized membrane protein (UPF0127 family)
MEAKRGAAGSKIVYAAALCIIVMVVAAAEYAYLQVTYVPAINNPSSFTLGNRTFNFTSYAANVTEDEKGLMNATVTNQTFMLFEFHNSSIYQFWMKDTYTQLDIIWVDGNATSGRIVYIVNATPCANYDPSQTGCEIYTPSGVADYVIETRAGFVQANNVSLYQKIRFNYA